MTDSRSYLERAIRCDDPDCLKCAEAVPMVAAALADGSNEQKSGQE